MDKKLLHLFHPVAIDNTEEANVGFYIDQTQGYAFAGFRRSWGIGDLLVRYRGAIEPFEWSHNYGVYRYSDNTFETQGLLPGKRMPDGTREGVTAEMCENTFATAYQQVAGHHQIVVNPKQVLDFLHKRTIKTGGVAEKVINIQGFENSNTKGQFVGKVEFYDGQQAILFKTQRGIMPMFIDEKNSLIQTRYLNTGDWVVVQPVGIVEGRRLVKVLRLHEPGIRMAIQHFKSGILMPGDARYSLHENEDGNTITEMDIKTFNFIQGQDMPNLKTAPMLTIQLDTFQRALKALSGYKRVEILYKNSHTPFVMAPFIKDGEPVVDVVASAFSPYKSGKVVTQ